MEKQVYNGTSVNNKICYSNLNCYGHNLVDKIVSPQPATAIPQIFCKYLPHPMPNQNFIVKPFNCVPYIKFN